MDIEVPGPPSLWSLLREGQGLFEVPRLAWCFPGLAAQPPGNGEPVLVFPGFNAGDASTALLRGYLRWLGYDAQGWGLGVNHGDVGALLPKLRALVERVGAAGGQPVHLIGWSLGGVLARDVARDHPRTVARVITLGSPVVGGPKYTTAGAVYKRRGYDLDAIEAAVAERNRIPIEAPITAIYSRSDGVVAWQACIDHSNPHAEHVEVESTHIGLGLCPEVYCIIAQRLAALSPS